MPVTLKPLIVVLAFAALTFHLAKPIALRFTAEADYSRRRKLWFTLTIVGMLSPSFWLFLVVAVPLLIAARRKDNNPIALYLLLLHVVPPLAIDIPVVGIAKLFELDFYRVLSFCILLPVAWRHWRSRQATQTPSGFGAADLFLIASGLLTVVLYVPADLPGHVLLPDSLTNMLRRAFLFLIDAYIVYFAVSRTCTERGQIVDALAAYCLGCALLAGLAVFETLFHWRLFAQMAANWTGDTEYMYYLMRGANLRAEVSTGHPLALGYLLALAFGFWLYLKASVPSWRARVGAGCLFWAGLVATYSRGTWVGAIAILMVFTLLSPRALSRLLKTGAVTAITLCAVLASPLGARIESILPWMGGKVGSESVTYRQRLAQRSWELITSHPWFGDQLALLKMEDLRQGEGIIDLVNTYATVALFYGLLGVLLFMGVILVPLFRAYSVTRRVATLDPDLAFLGASLSACIVGILVMLTNCSFILAYPKMFYVLAGLGTAYARLGQVVQPQAGREHEPARAQEQH